MTVKVLETIKDKQGVDVVIKHTTQLAFSPALPMFMKHHSELMSAGHANPIFIATNKSQAVYAEIAGKVVGEIAFDIKEDYVKAAYIIAGAVEPQFRSRGIYKMLHSYLEQIAKAAGCTKIRSDVHPDNANMIKTFNSLGKRIVFHRVEKNI
jgi:ribosomal protein S18 acetylase RimI-like enzyme